MGWFDIEKIDDETYVISENKHYEETNIYYLIGEKFNVCIDTGMGLYKLKNHLKEIDDKEIRIINTHYHWDHFGNNDQFEEIFISEITKNKINQYDEEEKKKVKKLLIKNVDEKYIPPKKIIEKYGFFNPKNAKIIKDGDTIDLGNRKLKIISTPGHTDDSVSIYDERGYIFIGDFMYEGELWASTSDNDPVKYYQSLKKLNENYPELKGIYSGHFTPDLGADYISKMYEVFSELKEKNLLKKGIGNYKKGDLEVIL